MITLRQAKPSSLADIREAEQIGVRATPTIFVNGQEIKDWTNYAIWQSALTSASTK